MNLTETTNCTHRDGIIDTAIVRTLMAKVGHGMETFRALSDIRVRVDGNTAQLTCYLMGQHHPVGQAPSVETHDGNPPAAAIRAAR